MKKKILLYQMRENRYYAENEDKIINVHYSLINDNSYTYLETIIFIMCQITK